MGTATTPVKLAQRKCFETIKNEEITNSRYLQKHFSMLVKRHSVYQRCFSNWLPVWPPFKPCKTSYYIGKFSTLEGLLVLRHAFSTAESLYNI
jgi:hypothetical protein